MAAALKLRTGALIALADRDVPFGRRRAGWGTLQWALQACANRIARLLQKPLTTALLVYRAKQPEGEATSLQTQIEIVDLL